MAGIGEADLSTKSQVCHVSAGLGCRTGAFPAVINVCRAALFWLTVLLCQILKQAELREFRKHEDRSTPSFGRRASRPLEAKWRLNIPRSPLCEGCGVRTVAAAEGSSGSKAWKCGPCVRAIEEVGCSLLPTAHKL